MPATIADNEVTILARVLGNGQGALPAATARYFLTLGFSDREKARMHELAVRNQQDDLSPAEHEELIAYAKAGSMLSILKSKSAARSASRRKNNRSPEALMNAALVRHLWRRAGRCCEYCRMPQRYDDTPFEIDHIIAWKHGGLTAPYNLALSCFFCNSFKGSDIGSLDPKTLTLTPLFNPRRNKWSRHFRWRGAYLIGRTAIGRTTVALLNMNDPFRVALRAGLIDEGLFPFE